LKANISLVSLGFTGLSLPYFSRQLIAREVDLERIRRAAPKGGAPLVPSAAKKKASAAAAQLPNHLQTLKPKPISAPNVHSAPKQQVNLRGFACLAFT